MNIPAGTLIPKVIIVRAALIIIADPIAMTSGDTAAYFGRQRPSCVAPSAWHSEKRL